MSILAAKPFDVEWVESITQTNLKSKYTPHRSNYTPPDPEHICPRDYPRASLTSIQVRILSRLRDRPPSYESHHSYDERIQREQENQRAIDASIRERSLNANEFDLSGGRAPPCYDGGLVSVRDIMYLNKEVFFSEN